jgi:transaldolase
MSNQFFRQTLAGEGVRSETKDPRAHKTKLARAAGATTRTALHHTCPAPTKRSANIKKMKATQKLQNLGQSLWLDNITRALLTSGTLEKYINELNVTGLTSNPTIFDQAISKSKDYDQAIEEKVKQGKSGEALFFELAIEDLQKAADLFLPIYHRTNGVDGFVSLEVSPELANDTHRTSKAAKHLHDLADRENLFIKIPGTPEGIPAIEEAIFAGIPVNVTLLFSADHYIAASEAYLRGIERRLDAGLSPFVNSVASVFISRWDVKVKDKVGSDLANKLGIAVAGKTYMAYLEMLKSPRMLRLENWGARPQRLLWASTGVKDPNAVDTLYLSALAAPLTVNTMPEGTLKALADHGEIGDAMATNPEESVASLAKFAEAGIDVDAIASQLQVEGAESFVKSWTELMKVIESKSNILATA